MYRIEKYLSESVFEGNKNNLELETSRLEFTVKQNQTVVGETRILSQDGTPVHCIFCSNHYRMQCITPEFTAREGVLKYKFDGYGLEPGDVIEGEITILSNAGEYPIPFKATVDQAYEHSTLGSIRNLFHFANLAHSDFEEAVRLFYEEDFKKLFTGHDRQYFSLYRGLSAHKGNAHNVDQFLIAIHKKQAASFEIPEQALLLGEADTVHENIFEIKRNGWGYTYLTVEVVGGFLQTDKQVLTAEDFIGDTCKFKFTIDVERLRGGRNLGKFVFHFGGESVSCDIAIHMPTVMERQLVARKEFNKHIAQLMQYYMEYTTFSPKPEECLQNMERVIDQINNQSGKNLRGRLLQTHVLLEMKRENEARWILSHVDTMIDGDEISPAEYSYYLYLTARLDHEESTNHQVANELLDIVHDEPMEFLPVCFYLRMMSAAKASPIKKLAVYEEYFYKGSNSPILYRDAWAVLEDGMAYLTKLGEFEIAVIRFAMKYGLFTQDAARQVNHLAKRKHEMSRAMYYMLVRSYEIFPDDETLTILCSQMIRMELRGKDHFKWYAKAVERELRITTLYEYYLMSMDMNETKLPPQIVLMYFAYDCRLDDTRKAFLYRLILEHRAQIRPIFNQYASKIEQFTWEMLEKESINENLAVLYKYLLNEDDNLERAKAHLLHIAFCHQIEASGPFSQVVLIEDKLEKETTQRLERGHAFLNCLASDYVILLEDKEGNRYADASLYTETKLMPAEKIAMRLQKEGEDSIEFLLYSAELEGELEFEDKDAWPIYEKLALSNEVEEVYRQKIFTTLLQTYYENDESERLASLLEDFQFEQAGKALRCEVVRYLIGSDQDEKAFSVLYDYGFEDVSSKALTRLIGRNIPDVMEPGCNEKMLALIYHTFLEGKYTPEMLQYLCKHYWGSLRQMRDIYMAAVKFDIDAAEIAERIIQVALFDRGFIAQLEEIFAYYQQNAKQRRDSIVRRYVLQLSYDYFVNQQLPQKSVFEVIEGYLREDTRLEDVCQVAYLYYMSTEQSQYTDLQKRLIEKLVRYYVYRKSYVPFMEPFAAFIPWLKLYTKWTYVEYRAQPGAKVMLHYVQNQEDGEYIKEQMVEFACGYFCQKFMLLFGEAIQYYFVEFSQGEEHLTESGFIEKSDIMDGDIESRFSLLNDLMMSVSLGDQATQQTIIGEYRRKEKLIKLLFQD